MVRGTAARDAVSLDPDATVFQVKFTRERRVGRDAAQTLINAIEAELPKIKALAERGAAEYVIMTNLQGSSARDSGAMDTVQEYLNTNVPIRSRVMWRADLDTALIPEYNLRWHFSEIATSGDMLRMIVSEQNGFDQRRLQSVLKSFMRAQYDQDANPKFKQADLQSTALLDLFVDVPAVPLGLRTQGMAESPTLRSWSRVVDEASASSPSAVRRRAAIHYPEPPPVGGATLLLSAAGQSEFSRLVIEGAPGQGKSTLAQYACQVQRMRFLDSPELGAISPAHRSAPARLPLKIDLRDLAAWLGGRSPFAQDLDLAQVNTSSLESFIAHLVSHFSGGQSFTIDDLYVIVEAAPLLIVFDGLDEVASTKERRTVIEAVNGGVNRLSDRALSLQCAVTSRPAAVPNAPRFSGKLWTYASLISIDTALISEYCTRWAAARMMDPVESADLRTSLLQKLQSEHIKELARNPMQLTILLWLVNARGQSLPDQRTALYDSYMEVFFNREAEKSRIVRNNRLLLLSLHGYIAWVLHARAEKSQSGSVGQSELRAIIQKYLTTKGFDPDAVEDVFTGMVQRVVALVSRVEGTFEFEVQPLREYFAARHLYNTSPYSPPGAEKKGTKPQIFEALAPNPYWQNVARFYAGCYSDGELPSLSLQLQAFTEDGSFALTSAPRTLTTQLLGDRVFTQQPHCTKQLVRSSFDSISSQLSVMPRYERNQGMPILALPADIGGRVAIDSLFQLLEASKIPTGLDLICSVLATQCPRPELKSRWIAHAQGLPVDRLNEWIDTAGALRLLINSSPDESSVILQRIGNADPAVRHRLVENGLPVALPDKDLYLTRFLDGNFVPRSFDSEYGELLSLLDSYLWLGQRTEPMEQPDSVRLPAEGRELLSRIRKEVGALWSGQAGLGEAASNVISVLTEVQPHSFYVFALANLAARDRSRELGRGAGHTDLFDESRPILDRVRYASYRGMSAAYWEKMSYAAKPGAESLAWCLLFLTWASNSTLLELFPRLTEVVDGMTQSEFDTLEGVASTARSTAGRTRLGRSSDARIVLGSMRCFALTIDRLAPPVLQDFAVNGPIGIFSSSRRASSVLMDVLIDNVLRRAQRGPISAALGRIREAQNEGASPYIGARWFETAQAARSPLSAVTARTVMKNCSAYPPELVWSANISVLSEATARISSVSDISEAQQWAANV